LHEEIEEKNKKVYYNKPFHMYQQQQQNKFFSFKYCSQADTGHTIQTTHMKKMSSILVLPAQEVNILVSRWWWPI